MKKFFFNIFRGILRRPWSLKAIILAVDVTISPQLAKDSKAIAHGG